MSSEREGRRPVIAVVGDGDLERGDDRLEVAHDMGRGIVDEGWTLLTGGLGGVMAEASRGAHASERYTPGSVVGLLPGDEPVAANPWVDVVIPTGLGIGRNTLVAHADAVVAIGGRAGTLSEIAIAWQLGRLIVAMRGAGWAGRLVDEPLDDRLRHPHLDDDRIHGADDAREAIALLTQWLPRYL